MPYTETERKTIQSRMFGCSTAEIDALVTPECTRLEIALFMLSDAQELLMLDSDDDRIRQTINRAKYLIDKTRENGDCTHG